MSSKVAKGGGLGTVTIVLWVTSLAALAGLAHLALSGARHVLEEELGAYLEQWFDDLHYAVASGESFDPREAVQVDAWQEIEGDFAEEESFSAFLSAYVDEIAGGVGEAGAMDRRLRLLLLGERELAEYSPSLLRSAYELMWAEVPERFRARLEALVEPYLVRLIEQSPKPVDTEGTWLILEDWGRLDAPCLSLIDPEGQVLAGGMEGALNWRGDGERWTQLMPVRAGTERCWVSVAVLDDGGRLVVGDQSPALDEVVDAQGELLALALVVGVAGVGGVGGLAHYRNRLSRQRFQAVMEAVRRGELGERIDETSDPCAARINEVLEHVEARVEDIRRVSDSIAHDLRTPLTRLRGQLELLLRLGGRSEEAVETVIGEADQLLATFNSLLRIAQLETGSTGQRLRRFDWARLLRDSADFYQPAFEDRAIALQCDVPSSEVPGVGDPELWMQAVANLLDNALKYTPKDGSVRLGLVAGEGAVTVSVHDSGPGIPEFEQANVFKRFYRLQDHRSETGNGLGLSLVAAVCKLHHATIELANDQGLRVTIWVPTWSLPGRSCSASRVDNGADNAS